MPTVIVEVYDADTGRPVGFGVMVCLDGVCAPTGADGKARLVVSPGEYELTVGGGAYDVIKKRISVRTDKRIKVTLRRILL